MACIFSCIYMLLIHHCEKALTEQVRVIKMDGGGAEMQDKAFYLYK